MKYQQNKYAKPTKKDRRNSGRVIAKIYNPIEQPLEFVYWDDWRDYRDSYRQPNDNSQIRSVFTPWSQILEIDKYNKKLKKLLKRRKVMRYANNNRNG